MAGSKIESMTDEECRAYYRRIRGRSEARSASIFDLAVATKLHTIVVSARSQTAPTTPTPQQWCQMAREVRFKCGRCGGTGQFITMMENGVLKGPGGECFRCKGKGTQNDHDVRRNEVHDQHYTGRL